jgi:hypothetical protein
MPQMEADAGTTKPGENIATPHEKQRKTWKRLNREEDGMNNMRTTQEGVLGAPRVRPNLDIEDAELQPAAKKVLIQVPSLEECLGKDVLDQLRKEEEYAAAGKKCDQALAKDDEPDSSSSFVVLLNFGSDKKYYGIEATAQEEEDGDEVTDKEATIQGAAGQLTGANDRACQEP